MITPRWLNEDDILALHGQLLVEHGGSSGTRDANLIAWALRRPLDKFHYDNNCNVFELAAAYSFGLAKNHPFIDGNKRIAFVSGVLFLELNGYQFHADEAESAVIFEALAAGNVDEAMLAHFFNQNTACAGSS